MPNPTPGEVAYAAYHQGTPLPWTLLPAYEQAQWEAAAQAVLDAWQAQPRLETHRPDARA